MEIFERYVNEVGRRLPSRLRSDVETELRSSLEDALEARREKETGRSDEELATALLQEMGEPAALAASYRPQPQHLIGPTLFHSYVKTLKIAIGVVGGFIVLEYIFALATGDVAFLSQRPSKGILVSGSSADPRVG